MPAAPRTSSLTFKGPAQPTRTRRPPVIVDPIVPRTAKPAKKRPSTSSASQKTRTAGKRAPGRPKRESGASDASENQVPAKRRRPQPVDEDDEESDGGVLLASGRARSSGLPRSADVSGDLGDAPARAYEHRVSRDVVAKRWRLLSSSARDDLRFLAERAARRAIDEVYPSGPSSKAAQNARKALASFVDDFETLLTTLAVPPLASALAGAARGKGTGQARQVEIGRAMAASELRETVADLQRALEAEEANVEGLQARVDEEQRAAFGAEKGAVDEQAADPLVAPVHASRLSAASASTSPVGIPGLAASSLSLRHWTSASRSRAWLAECRHPSPTHVRTSAAADVAEGQGDEHARAARVRRALELVRRELRPMLA